MACCYIGDAANEAVNRHEVADFDNLPVESEERIVGLLARKVDYKEEKVADAMQPLDESILMSSEGSMLDFIENAHERPFVFLIERNGICGAVTLSDIQKVEARPAIFLRITLFEILLNNWLRINANKNDEWLKHVSENQRKNIERHFQKHRDNGEEIDKIAAASLTPKLKACKRLKLFDNLDDRDDVLNAIVKLRDQLAHAHEFAHNVVKASDVSKRIRRIRDYITHLESLCEPTADE